MGMGARNKRGGPRRNPKHFRAACQQGREAKKSTTGAALSNGLTDTGSVLQVEETASVALYVRSPSKTIEAF